MSKLKKVLLMCTAYVLVAALAIGGTIAYLTDTDSDVNVMTVGNVSIRQNEQQRVEKDGEFTSELEDFEQGKILMPVTYPGDRTADTVKIGGYELEFSDNEANYVDKIVSVTNTGKSDAYVRTLVAVPTGGADWEPDPVSANNCWLHWNMLKGYNAHWTLNTTPDFIEIDGKGYYVWEFVHTAALQSGKTTFPVIKGFYMDQKVDHDDNGFYMTYADGTTKRIEDVAVGDSLNVLVLTQAVQAAGFDSAATALDTGFGDVTNEKAAEWFEGVMAENSAYLPVPSDAVAVSNFEDFQTALATGGNYQLVASFTVETGNYTVAANTAFYNNDPTNVISFAQNARLKTAENADLALYGVKIDGGGSFSMVDGEFTTDSTACNNDAILMAYAGSTLTLGKGTVVENVVSNCPAVAWAKGTVDNRATIIFDGATVRNCAGGSGTVINVDNYGAVYIEDGTVITGNVSYNKENHGIIRIYNPWDPANVSTLTMNGGEFTNNYFSGNGAIGLYYGKMTLNGGELSGNTWYSYGGKTNGFYCVVYVHSNSQFIMNDGEISGNTITDGAINAINSSIEGAITFNGGTVTNNINTRNDNKDALAAVCYPYSMQKTVVISDNANVTGTVYNHAIEGDVVVRNYSEISEYFGG